MKFLLLSSLLLSSSAFALDWEKIQGSCGAVTKDRNGKENRFFFGAYVNQKGCEIKASFFQRELSKMSYEKVSFFYQNQKQTFGALMDKNADLTQPIFFKDLGQLNINSQKNTAL